MTTSKSTFYIYFLFYSVDFSKGSPSAKKPSQLTAQVPSPQASGSSSVRGAGQARKKQPAKKKKKGKGW